MDGKDEKLIDELVGDILNDTPDTQEPGHLTRFWKNTPPEACNPLFPGMPTRLKYLARYILEAENKRNSSAREQVFRLYQYLSEEGEDIPDILVYWVDRLALNGPVRRRGRPEETWRDNNVFLAFKTLRLSGRSHERSLVTIGDKIRRELVSVRDIMRKVIRNSPFR